jgi:hypothetical protein
LDLSNKTALGGLNHVELPVVFCDTDFQRYVDYIHWNPVKHGMMERVADWPHSLFYKYVRQGLLPLGWAMSTCC